MQVLIVVLKYSTYPRLKSTASTKKTFFLVAVAIFKIARRMGSSFQSMMHFAQERGQKIYSHHKHFFPERMQNKGNNGIWSSDIIELRCRISIANTQNSRYSSYSFAILCVAWLFRNTSLRIEIQATPRNLGESDRSFFE